MIKVIVYDEAYEIFNIEKYLRDDVEIVGYLKNDTEYFGEYINGIKVYNLNDLLKALEETQFNYILVNSRRYNILYDKIRELKLTPEYILDVSFFFYDIMSRSIEEKLSYCKDSSFLDFDMMFLGRNYIKDEIMSEYFNDYINISNIFSDIHYDYHLLYYLIKNNKLDKNIKIGIFTNYSMIYENIDFKEDKYDFVKIFESVFSVHNNTNLNNTFSEFCLKNFRDNISKIFKDFDLSQLILKDDFSISKDNVEKIQYDTQIETINYRESNTIAFKLNKNIISQQFKMLSRSGIDIFLIIPPVHRFYRTYINKTLQKEFYLVLNNSLNENIRIFDYFDLNLSDDCFSSPTNLNLNGCREFLKVLSRDIKGKFSNIKACNNL